MKNKKSLRNMGVLIFDNDRKTVSVEEIRDIQGDTVETNSGVLHLSEAAIYTDEWNGKTMYAFHVDLPAKVEAENLKKLRRSTVLSNLFNYSSAKPFDLMGFMPWVALIISLFF